MGAALFAVAMYVGYFGAAAGVLLLVVLTAMITEPLVRVNAIKNAVSGMANTMAAACFAIWGDVRWNLVVPLAAGFLMGGWIGPKIARRVPARGIPGPRQPGRVRPGGEAGPQRVPLRLLMPSSK